MAFQSMSSVASGSQGGHVRYIKVISKHAGAFPCCLPPSVCYFFFFLSFFLLSSLLSSDGIHSPTFAERNKCNVVGKSMSFWIQVGAGLTPGLAEH